MAPAIADRRPKYVTKSCYVPMSELVEMRPTGLSRMSSRIPQLQT